MPIEIIAECASNHGGSIPLAKEFIWRCAEAGADWVKFQTTRVKHLRKTVPVGVRVLKPARRDINGLEIEPAVTEPVTRAQQEAEHEALMQAKRAGRR